MLKEGVGRSLGHQWGQELAIRGELYMATDNSTGPWMLGVASRAPGGSFCRCRVKASFVSYTKASWTYLSRFGSRALVGGVMVVTGRIESKPDFTCARGDGRWQRDSLI